MKAHHRHTRSSFTEDNIRERFAGDRRLTVEEISSQVRVRYRNAQSLIILTSEIGAKSGVRKVKAD